MQRRGLHKETTAGSYPVKSWTKYQTAKLHCLSPRKRQKLDISHRGLRIQAVLQQDRRRQDNASYADAATRVETRHQTSATTTAAETYVPLRQAQDLLSEVVDASSPTKPVLLRFCKSGQQVGSSSLLHRHQLDFSWMTCAIVTSAHMPP